MWRSRYEGRNWQRVAWSFDAGPVYDGDIGGGLLAVASVDGRLLTVGERLSGKDQQHSSSDIELWTSTDSVTWTQVNDPNTPPTNTSGLHDIILIGATQFMLADEGDATGITPAVDVSADTMDWTLIGMGEPASRTVPYLRQILAYPGGYVALGGVAGSMHELVLSSPDGRSWSGAPDALPDSPHGWQAAVVGDEIMAISNAGIYVSTDGLNWNRAFVSLPTTDIGQVISDGSSVLVVDSVTGQIWRADAAALR